jgi:hypothetical protein
MPELNEAVVAAVLVGREHAADQRGRFSFPPKGRNAISTKSGTPPLGVTGPAEGESGVPLLEQGANGAQLDPVGAGIEAHRDVRVRDLDLPAALKKFCTTFLASGSVDRCGPSMRARCSSAVTPGGHAGNAQGVEQELVAARVVDEVPVQVGIFDGGVVSAAAQGFLRQRHHLGDVGKLARHEHVGHLRRWGV